MAITLKVDDLDVEIGSDRFALPEEVTGNGSQQPEIIQISCNSNDSCSFSREGEISLECESGVCNPVAKTLFWRVEPEIDLESQSNSVREVKEVIDEISIESATYVVQENSMGVDLPEVRLYWSSPSGTITTDDLDDSTKLLGTLGPFAANVTGNIEDVVLNPEGIAALEDYLTQTSLKMRLHVVADVDLEPGDPLPFPDSYLALNFAILVEIVALDF